MKNVKLMAIAIMAAICIVSCKKEDTTTSPKTNTPNQVVDPANLTKIGETYISGASSKAIVYADKPLFVGYNRLYVAMYDSVDLSRLTNGHFDLVPLMDMGTMMHSAPIEMFEDTVPSNQLWTSAVVFVMPSMMGGTWKLNLTFHNHKIDKEGEGELDVTVMNPTPAVMKSVITLTDSTKLFISLLQPTSPKIGLNNIEITIHKMEDMMTFSAVEDYTVEIMPDMPSMGHSSPNNVNPSHTSLGHYKGKVNFTMTGLWRVHIILKKNGVLVDDTQFFDITF